MSGPDKRSILVFELVGIVFIVLLGSALHFTFDLSGGNPFVAAFSAVNESLWEHLKLSFWPAVIYAILERGCLKKRARGFSPAKAIGVYLMPLAIVSFFYLYRAFSEESLFLDVSIFIVAVAIGQLVSYRLMTWIEASKIYTRISVIALIVLAGLFVIFTFYPPRSPMFQDPISGGYGIVK